MSPRRPACIRRVGGLAPLDDLDAGVFDLCQRLREQVKSIVAVPSSIVPDHRPALTARELTRPIREVAWQGVVEWYGPHTGELDP
jgi:hypothetical protein